MRKKAPLAQTYLCAVKFWRSARGVATLASGVRHVVRSQTFKSSDIYQIERELEREGLITISGKLYKSVGLTTKGERQAKCDSVKLSPWTDKGYPGAELDGVPRALTPAQSRKRVRELKRHGCKVHTRRYRGGAAVFKECPKRK